MTREEALKRFMEARDQLTVTADPLGSPASQAFIGMDRPPMVEVKKPPDLSEPPSADVKGMLLDVGAGMGGETLAGKAVSKLPIPAKYKIPAEIAARVVGGAVSAGTAQLGWQNVKRVMGVEGAPDNFEQSLAISAKSAVDQAFGGAYGQLLSKASELSPLARKVDPERLRVLQDVQENMKKTYERIGGTPMVEDMRSRWNPMRILKPLGTELDDTAVAQRFRDHGLDPEMARRVVLQGGYTTADLLDNTPYAILQSVAEGTASGKKYMQKYKGTRSQLYRLMIDDLSGEFGDAIPEEKLGEAIRGAVNNNFNFPNAVMNQGLNNIRNTLPSDFKINAQGMRTYFKNQGIDANNPVGAMIFGPAPLDPKAVGGEGLPKVTTFDAIQKIRSNLSSLIHAKDQDPEVVRQANIVAKTLDNSIMRQLPTDEQRNWYKLSTQADDVLNEGQFRDQFLKGMLNTKQGYRKYAKKILADGDVTNFNTLEAAVGPEEANKVRRSISEITLQNAVKEDGTMDPASLTAALNQHGKYGEYFLNSVLGPEWVGNVKKMRGAMDMMNEAAKGRSLSEMGLGSLKYASVAPFLWDIYHGQLDKGTVAEAAVLFTAPNIIARTLTSPKATANMVRMAELLQQGAQRPHTFARLVARTSEAIGVTPEKLMAMADLPPATGLERVRDDLSKGKMPSTGNFYADMFFNPDAAMKDVHDKMQQQGPWWKQ